MAPNYLLLTRERPGWASKFLDDAVILHFKEHFVSDDTELRVERHNPRVLDKHTITALLVALRSLFAELFSGKDLISALVEVHIGTIRFGQYITASVLRKKPESDGWAFVGRYALVFFRGVFVYASALRAEKMVQGVSLGDSSYLDGICYDFFLQKEGVAVYCRNHPINLICVKGEHASLTELSNRFSLPWDSGGSIDKQKHVDAFMSERLKNPNDKIFYMRTSFQKLPSRSPNVRSKSVIVYAHSFTDAQLEHGYPGFKSTLEWLDFSLNTLISNSKDSKFEIFVRPHPNFFASDDDFTGLSRVDRTIWNSFLRRYAGEVKFLSSEQTNMAMLSNFRPGRDILISQHGNAVVEGAYLGFSSISSSISPWSDKFAFTRTWSNKAAYATQLESRNLFRQLSNEDLSSVTDFIYNYYMRPKGAYSQRFFPEIVSRHSGKNVKDLLGAHSLLNPFGDSSSEKLAVRELSNNIEIW